MEENFIVTKKNPIKKVMGLAALLALLATFLIATFTACGTKQDAEQLSGTATVVIRKNEQSEAVSYSVDLTAFTTQSSVADVIVSLSRTTNLYYKGTTSQYGLYLTEMGTATIAHNDEFNYDYEVDTAILQENMLSSTYLYVYTSLESDKSVYDTTTITYNNTTLYASNYSVSAMSLAADVVIYFTEITYSY
jgi:hypothetical protein